MNHDIEKFIERKMPFFYAVISLWLHKSALEETIGVGFTKSTYIYENGVCKFYLSKKEARDIANRVQEMAKANDDGFKKWYEKAKSLNAQADRLLSDYKNDSQDTSVLSYDRALNILEGNAAYCTVLSYWTLYGINEALEEGVKRESFGEILRMYEELKSETRYPQLAKDVFGAYFKKAMVMLDISYELATYMHPNELRDVIRGKKSVTVEELNRRLAGCGIMRKGKFYEVEYIFDKNVLNKYSDSKTDQGEIKGKIAYKGKASGPAKIVNDIDDMKKFEDGDILISIQSSPALMPAITKCSAIVTDEGGIMCHASVISRELKKPCIIGTKIATKVLKDGDIVEVDANNGTVRKIA